MGQFNYIILHKIAFVQIACKAKNINLSRAESIENYFYDFGTQVHKLIKFLLSNYILISTEKSKASQFLVINWIH